MQPIPLRALQPHPAQMRTTYDPEALAALTLQVYENGLDAWQPILASATGDAYHIVSGHRRHKAQLLALALRDETPAPEEVTIGTVRAFLDAGLEEHESLDAATAVLLAQYGGEEIPVVPFAGGEKAEILALQRANYGGEAPDALGVAHSFRRAAEAGATVEEIARNCGQHRNYVRNHLALTEIPPELARRIAAGELPMSAAPAVADLPEPQRAGLAIFILANEPGTLTAKAIKACAKTLHRWPGLQMPLMAKHQSQRNVARALVRLWSGAARAYPEDAYAAAAMFIYQEAHEEPWGSEEKTRLWFGALGGDTYFSDGQVNWTAVAEHLLPEVSCATCPIAGLPDQLLDQDLSLGRGGPLGMPCRAGETATRCLHGLAENDPFDVRVPWAWSEHPGVVNEGGEYRVTSYEDLLAAWKAQKQREIESEIEVEGDPDGMVEEKEAVTRVAGEERETVEQTQRPIDRQRGTIANFMKRYGTLAATHPFATPCHRCRHKLDGSPTKDESVPPCAWADRPRKVWFRVLATEETGAPAIPVCRQFAPADAWHEIIPAYPDPPPLPRAWLMAQISRLVRATNRNRRDRLAFEFLTGRPMTTAVRYGDWFAEKLEAGSGELSDAQLFTLFLWAHSEWERLRAHRDKTFSLPVNGNAAQFAAYAERPWRVEDLTTEDPS